MQKLMKYTPLAIKSKKPNEYEFREISVISKPSIVRSIEISGFKISNNKLFLINKAFEKPLSIHIHKIMEFGTERITALEYFRRVLELGDRVDALVLPETTNEIPISYYWIKIIYTGKPSSKLIYSKKDDGLFALRAKSGEKAERLATRFLRERYGHAFSDSLCYSPGFFEIRYEGKKNRLPDRVCPECGLTLEVKKRNRDEKFRVSHSNRRPFISENAINGWHAFVFPDMRPRFIPNSKIIDEINSGNFEPGSDEYDAWADLTLIDHQIPPRCTPEAT